MIASWLLYSLLCALGLALAGVLAERAMLAGRAPVRFVWIGAVVLSLVLPGLAFRFAERPVVADETSVSTSREAALDSILTAWQFAAPVSSAAPKSALQPAPHSSWRVIVARADETLSMLWLLLSMAMCGYLLSGMMALAWLRRGWKKQTVLGVPVLVSEHTGPAVLTGLASTIVVPRWALAMDAPRLSLMLKHEQEHVRARDGQVLFAAQLALIAMPWNIALWWQIARLRVALELDCDARVLRHTDARTYGDLLLEVVRPGRRSRFMVATAFAEQATELERRIRVMTRRRERVPRGARVAAGAIALAAVTAAWISPRPSRPPHSKQSPAPQTTVALVDTARPQPAAVVSADTSHHRTLATDVQRVVAPPVPPPAVAAPARPAVLAPRDTPPPNPVINPPGGGRGGRGGGRGGVLRDPADVAESVFRRVFDQITLTPAQESSARALLLQLARDERAEADSAIRAQANGALPAVAEFMKQRMAIREHRDSGLVALLTNDADRATLEAHLNPRPGYDPARAAALGGGRRGGPPVNPPNTEPGGRGVGGGRVGGRGVQSPYPIPVAEQTLHRLFDGITLTSDQEKTAFTIIALAVEEEDDLHPLVPPPRLALLREVPLNPLGGSAVVVMSEESRSAILALVGSDADRATVDSRIGVAGRPPAPPRPPQ